MTLGTEPCGWTERALAQAGRCDSAAGVSDAGSVGVPLCEAPGNSKAAAAIGAEGDDATGKLAKWLSGCAGCDAQHWLWLTFHDCALEERFRAFHAAQLAKVRGDGLPHAARFFCPFLAHCRECRHTGSCSWCFCLVLVFILVLV